MESIVGRIEVILRSKGLSPSKLADEIGVQRSGISHIMSGRNKPSLDFIMKVLDAYPEIDVAWLLKGEGSMSRNADLFDFEEKEPVTPKPARKTEEKVKRVAGGRKATKVLIFYDDQSFEEIRAMV